jgi:hypothetical protein
MNLLRNFFNTFTLRWLLKSSLLLFLARLLTAGIINHRVPIGVNLNWFAFEFGSLPFDVVSLFVSYTIVFLLLSLISGLPRSDGLEIPRPALNGIDDLRHEKPCVITFNIKLRLYTIVFVLLAAVVTDMFVISRFAFDYLFGYRKFVFFAESSDLLLGWVVNCLFVGGTFGWILLGIKSSPTDSLAADQEIFNRTKRLGLAFILASFATGFVSEYLLFFDGKFH